jgi:hypothetical protein
LFFKWVNVHRYRAVIHAGGVQPLVVLCAGPGGFDVNSAAGLYKLNAVDPCLESARFQPLNLSK